MFTRKTQLLSASHINAIDFLKVCISLLYTPTIIQAFLSWNGTKTPENSAVILHKKIDNGISEEDRGHQGFSLTVLDQTAELDVEERKN